ncbi:MAG: hypothetical protein A2991_01705 [Candidatus Terrybacteria bacterium RIFCSPLOWO2_01_FULL_58_14]|uniref:MBL fold metallo-hydrolase n=2 Tax=Candidatus Terryibacteriota TaxID=1817920 RepID=A0A1G2Q0A9_9BACT|nr:MAG: hypothetical protein A2682_02170 [Candidatus Terrybacteria bacterium RIFCSPHIGHO2_01_FULL_58_15]OHA53271.1 MAG: hypothetical protein A2991_01705 [Candidatus Terrybacteria bacterium RIFCSPLOWO2_01_FULL_58_14]
MIVTWYGGRCMLVEERVRGQTPRSTLFFPETKTSRVRTLEEKADVIVGGENVKVPQEGRAHRIVMPGEYDVAGFFVRGMAFGSRSGSSTSAYVTEAGDTVFCLFGEVAADTLSEQDVEALGLVDILALPVPSHPEKTSQISGLGDVVRAIEPKVVLPLTEDAKLRAAVRKELGVEGETTGKLTALKRDFPEEGFRVVFLDAQ